MSEEYLLVLLARARGSTGGILLIIVGVLILVAFLVFAVVSVAGNVILMVTGTGPVVDFLGTGWGVLIGLVVAVVIILLGIAFLTRATPQPATTPSGSHSGTNTPTTPPATDPEEVEQLRTRLGEVEQERDELRTENEKLMAEASVVSVWDDPEFKFEVVSKKTFRKDSAGRRLGIYGI